MYNISCTDYNKDLKPSSCIIYHALITKDLKPSSCIIYHALQNNKDLKPSSCIICHALNNKDLKPTPCILYSMHCRITSICNIIHVYSTSQIYIYIPYIIYHTVHDILYTWDRLQILVIQCMIYYIHGLGCKSLLYSA